MTEPARVRQTRLSALGLLLVALAAPFAAQAVGSAGEKPGGPPSVGLARGGGPVWSPTGAGLEKFEGWRGLLLGSPLDTAKAGEADYDALPGVGGKLSRELARESALRGGFASPGELLDVKGVGPKKLEALSPWLAFSGAPGDARTGAICR